MKNTKIYKGCIILLIIILTLTLIACDEQPPSNSTQSERVTLEYKVKTDVAYSDDISPYPFVNGYAMFFDKTNDTSVNLDYSENTFNFIDENGEVLFDTPYNMVSFFNLDGIAVAKKSFYTDSDKKTETVTEYYMINTKNEIIKTFANENEFLTEYQTFPSPAKTTILEPIVENSNGYKVNINESQSNGTTKYQYCVINPHNETTHVISSSDVNGSIRFLSDDLIVCGYGSGNFGNGDYFEIFSINGKQISETKFQRIGNFDNGYAPIQLNGKLGLINKQGDIVVSPCIDIDECRHLVLHENKIIINDGGYIGIVEVKKQ